VNRLYDLKIPIIGLTGGIASGKSTVSSILSSQGERVICADLIIKKIYKKEDTINFIRKICPEAINKDLNINFPKLRSVFFSDKYTKEKIEKYLHPRIEEFFKNEISPIDSRIFYDVPLLFEKKMENYFDQIILVTISHDQQCRRLMKRDSISIKLANQIISSQTKQSKKEESSTYIIQNDRTPKELEEAVLKIYDKIISTT
jgi:dephospho-CoA kinase